MKHNLPTIKIEGKEYYLYFSYGSNLNMDQMSRRCPESLPLETAELPTHKLLFRGSSKRGYGVATVEHNIGTKVPGALWAVTERDFATLDRYEGYPSLYERNAVKVITEEGKVVEAVTYYMHQHYTKANPSDTYLNTIAAGYDDFRISVYHLFSFLDKHNEDMGIPHRELV